VSRDRLVRHIWLRDEMMFSFSEARGRYEIRRGRVRVCIPLSWLEMKVSFATFQRAVREYVDRFPLDKARNSP
jgi:hypothetical protein